VWAISAGYIDVVQELLNAGAQINVQGNWHPLHEACKHGYLEIAKLLIAAGAQVNNPSECECNEGFLHVCCDGHVMMMMDGVDHRFIH